MAIAKQVILVVTISLCLAIFGYLLWNVIPRLKTVSRIAKPKRMLIVAVGTLFGSLVGAYLFLNLSDITARDWVEISLQAGLVLVTGALFVSALEQAIASVSMADEMRQQRILESRPVIIQKAVYAGAISAHDLPDHFEIYNAGNGTAIELQVSLCLQRTKPYQPIDGAMREGFVRAGDTPVRFDATFPPDVAHSTFYVVSEYQSISSQGAKPTWYQTWLPCRLSVSGAVINGALEFDEVSEKDRLGILKADLDNGSRPK